MMTDIVLMHTTETGYPQSASTSSDLIHNFGQPRRNPNISKWNVLFDKKSTEWISFKPKLGLQVYPCYACRNMFGSKNSFLDHVNRRGILLKYKCSYCTQQDVWTFYNPCSLLLHTRQHYTLLGGQINLESLEVSIIPYGLAGFLPNPQVTPLYDVQDDNVGETSFINCRFYSPLNDCMGNAIVKLFPNELLFYCADENTREITSLTLKQVSSNIPRCMFVLFESNECTPKNGGFDISSRILKPGQSCIVSIKEEQPDIQAQSFVEVEEIVSPPKTKLIFTKCPECKEAENVPMSEHFLRTNQPLSQSLRCCICKYIAPTKCSLQAHQRIHNNSPPFVCPECGRDFPCWEELYEHMNDVCFHLTKQVRIKCSGKRCGKIFAQTVTFASHFLMHIAVLLKCGVCGDISSDELEFLHHSSLHEVKQLPIKVFICNACTESKELLSQDALQDHIRKHASTKLLYVYICKRCHSYFRSPVTYATHSLRCARLIPPQVNPNLIVQPQTNVPRKKYCAVCKIHVVHNTLFCPNCGSTVDYATEMGSDSDTDQAYCPLCDQELMLSEIEEHAQNQCKFGRPIIVLSDCSLNRTEIKEELCSPNNKRKRNILRANCDYDFDEMLPLSGMYHCKLCEYSSKVRVDFQKHIMSHRSVTMAYQCMECGECFVVRPLLSKHLLFYHNISNLKTYFEQNSCFDKKEDMLILSETK